MLRRLFDAVERGDLTASTSRADSTRAAHRGGGGGA
jgi:hypothetical protein